jgi:hypothetical protein
MRSVSALKMFNINSHPFGPRRRFINPPSPSKRLVTNLER